LTTAWRVAISTSLCTVQEFTRMSQTNHSVHCGSRWCGGGSSFFRDIALGAGSGGGGNDSNTIRFDHTALHHHSSAFDFVRHRALLFFRSCKQTATVPMQGQKDNEEESTQLVDRPMIPLLA
jgi:hypothetical protein